MNVALASSAARLAAAANQDSSWIPMVVCFAVVGIIVVMAILMGRRQPRRRAGTGRRAGAAGAYGYGYAGSDGGGWDAGGSACSDGGGSSGCGGGCGGGGA
ncbi:hypothetical protein, partial [Mycolicibacterium mucogenicum]|uniref:hypothetical protein n=1 Tax=Mycolicibacterium mucogenicum TaxID=56689 RepID=UPI0019513EBF